MKKEELNKILQCAIDFGYVDTDNIKTVNTTTNKYKKLDGDTK